MDELNRIYTLCVQLREAAEDLGVLLRIEAEDGQHADNPARGETVLEAAQAMREAEERLLEAMT